MLRAEFLRLWPQGLLYKYTTGFGETGSYFTDEHLLVFPMMSSSRFASTLDVKQFPDGLVALLVAKIIASCP